LLQVWETLGDFAALDAAGADPEPLGRSVNQRFDRLEVHVPATPRHVVRVRDVIAELRALPANIAYLCHDFAPNPLNAAGICPFRAPF
jgi:hypothetical protein